MRTFTEQDVYSGRQEVADMSPDAGDETDHFSCSCSPRFTLCGIWYEEMAEEYGPANLDQGCRDCAAVWRGAGCGRCGCSDRGYCPRWRVHVAWTR